LLFCLFIAKISLAMMSFGTNIGVQTRLLVFFGSAHYYAVFISFRFERF
jgi:hypothetical protein